LLRFLHLGLILLTVAAYLPPLINPDYFWPIATLGLLAPTLWFLTLLFGIYWFLRGDKAWWLSGITLLLGLEMMGSAFAIPGGAGPGGGEKIHVASLNGHGFLERSTPEGAKKYDFAIQFIDSLKVDILCLQEFQTGKAGDQLAQAIQSQTPLKYAFRNSEGRLALFARYPLSNGKMTFFSNRVNGYLFADVTTPTGSIRVFSVHLQTNGISNMATEVARERNLQEKKTWQKVKTMFGRYGRSNRIRTHQAEEILQVVKTTALPVVLCGDFNDVPTSYLYRLFREEFQDAQSVTSWGLGTTFPGLIPGLRIDYILPQATFRVADYERVNCAFSDHRAIRAILSLRPKK
jgi:endonuclease/exonuclease/phosphatase family metal-dependent hydrolase